MNVSIIYFSQTGNTKGIAQTIAETFEKEGSCVYLASIKEVEVSKVLQSDIIGFGSPTFESHAPKPVKDFIRSLPNLSGKKTFTFATGGGAGGMVIADMNRILLEKEASIINSFFSLGEVSHPAPPILGKSKGHPNRSDLLKTEDFAQSIFHGINSSKSITDVPKTGFYTLVGKIASLESLIRFLMPAPKLNKSKCINCRGCANECPMNMGFTTMYPTISKECIRCYRCMTSCSQKAFSVNWWYGTIVVNLFWNKHFMKWFGEYKGE